MMAWKPGRYLALIALVAVIVATGLVVRAGLGSTHHTTRTTPTTGPVPSRPARHHKRFYVIRAGDSLSGISVKTGVSVPRLEALNPSVDPNALQTGHRLKLRP